jgi:polyribonucleotide nucleotidyltransferase
MSMFDVSRVSVEVGGEEISFETGKLARQAGGAVVARSGDTMVLGTATVGNLRDVDFLPLTVDVEERHYAAGKIPGSFFRREGRSGEKATLTARMIDRPVRPLFPKGWHYETQIVCQPLSVEYDHPYDILAMNAASAAIAVSPIPVPTHVGAVRIGKLHGDFVINPSEETYEDLEMDLVVSGSSEAILMVECGSAGVSEAEVLDALDIAHEEIKKICATIEDLRAKAGKGKLEVVEPKVDPDLLDQIQASFGGKLDDATQIPEKLARQEAATAVEEQVLEQFAAAGEGTEVDPERRAEVSRAFDALEKDVIRRRIAVDKKRPDGRAQDEIRPIECEVDISPRVHGSALFTRGETQILSNVALGTSRMDMRIDNLGLQESKTFWHHYNFPPFSVGEAGFMRGPKRRDIGHGALAERALAATIPDQEDFPYVVRVVSETLESNGSSSMGSVCASSMALQAAGVPVSAPVAGVAMGLIKEGDQVRVLSDILGDEDHLGDMDFKIAGTEQGVTAVQMDIKIAGTTRAIMQQALDEARTARLHILGIMNQTLARPRGELSSYAPRIVTIHIKPDRIRDLIGPGGKVIRGITEETGVKIDVEDDGTVYVASADGVSMQKAIDKIRAITAEAEVGKIYRGTVRKIVDFGAFVEIFPGTDGLVHISQLANERVRKVSDVLKEGDVISVKVLEVDRSGKIRLSRKEAMKDEGQQEAQH